MLKVLNSAGLVTSILAVHNYAEHLVKFSVVLDIYCLLIKFQTVDRPMSTILLNC